MNPKIEADDCQMTAAFMAEALRLLKESKEGIVEIYWHGELIGHLIQP